ncbi:MAG: 4Fe-4S binding protein [Candidatus Jordarchaeum sp.]|uniref:4Fe-4S binding protein n=1 Tax=Candidatus Jordarchaeum sp. TaxID=2823881 RepID=UPI00404A593B
MGRKTVDLREMVKHVGVTGNFIKQDKARCKGCGRCVNICPMELWELRKNKAFLSEDFTEKCVECGSCWLVCESNAIEFNYPKGGTGVIWEYG